MLYKDGLHLFINDDIFLTICCVLDNHTNNIKPRMNISYYYDSHCYKDSGKINSLVFNLIKFNFNLFSQHFISVIIL